MPKLMLYKTVDSITRKRLQLELRSQNFNSISFFRSSAGNLYEAKIVMPGEVKEEKN